MGGGAWSASTYATTTGAAIRSGTTFAYSSAMASAPLSARKAHEDLDPKRTAGSGPFAGKVVREARDNDEHPYSLAIALGFDETGSMGNVPRVLQTKLGQVHGLLQRKGYVEDPQVLMAAYGDAQTGEPAPLQVGQFESDNKGDEDLNNVFLVGNGGGNGGESAALLWYYLGRAAQLDSLDKRGKKGYLFTIGDEVPLNVTKDEVTQFIGTFDDFESSHLTPAQALAYAQEKFEVFHIIIDNSAAHWQDSVNVYTKLLGKNAIVLQSEADVAETIATIIGVNEGNIDLDEGLDNLDEIGAGSSKESVGRALAKFGGTGKVVKADAPIDVANSKPASRL